MTPILQFSRSHVLLILVSVWISTPLPAQAPPEAVIYLDQPQQIIRGFGAANIVGWRPDMNDSDIANAFGNGDGQLGLSILRIRIPPVESQWSVNLATARKAHERGVTIIASPWSPPASMKTNNNLIGGRLSPNAYAAYAAFLNRFVQYMESNGVPIHAVSVQNEPDIAVTYESCDWDPEEMTTFIREHGDSIRTLIMAPESFQFRRPISDAILNDPEAESKTDIIAGHIYGGGLSPYPLAKEKGKEVWMTEYLLNKNASSLWSQFSQEEIWIETMDMLRTVQRSMQYDWNAYIWWYLKRYYSFIGEGDQGTMSGQVLKRGHAFAHFSRFIRPGAVRVAVTGPSRQGYTDVIVTAYRNEGRMVVVATNPQAEAKDVTLSVVGGQILGLQRHITSLNQTLDVVAPLTLAGDGRVTATLGPRSVSTFVSDPITTGFETDQPLPVHLSQNHPNPFNPSTVIRYQLTEGGKTRLAVYDLLGRQVAVLSDEVIPPGFHAVTFDATTLPSGVYVYRLETGGQTLVRRMTLVK